MIIGLGNSFRGDDGVGLDVAGRIRRIESHARPTGSLDLLDLWDGADEVIVVDAMLSGRPPGEVARFEPLEQPVEHQVSFVSTHGMGLLAAVELARRLGRLPRRLLVYGIEVADVSPGVGLSPPVAAAARRLAREIDHA
jgi:hydrogenase maturation protease